MGTNNSGGGTSSILSVVGTGPGSLDYLIPRARQELEQAEVVVGYRTYLDLISEIIVGKEVIESAMMQEVDRVKQAFDLAEQGRHVALVSGGDPGIYAMAGLVFEIGQLRNSEVEIRVIAGIAALNSCAERLGAPLMHDFATVSLSDLLTPWELIEKRITAAVDADFVLVIYNPRSKKRDWQLKRALEIIGAGRAPSTPIGMVRAATRADEEVVLTDLEHFDPELADMQTTVIVGNSSTFIKRGKMITPRGYHDKYQLG
ncbi:MAG: precorrin-3B C(17)-methyltransferase [Desulfocapsaceae bacterium]